MEAEASKTHPSRLRVSLVIGAAVILCGVSLFVVELWAAAAASASYDVARQAVSDLGVTTCGPLSTYDPPLEVCSPAHGLLNVTWIVTGLIVAIGVWFLQPNSAGTKGRIGTALVSMAALLQSVVGFAPADVNLTVHLLAALLGFLAQTLGLLMIGAVLLRRPQSGRFGLAVLILGITMLIGAILVTIATVGIGSIPLGIAERVVIYPFQLWMILAGVRSMQNARQN